MACPCRGRECIPRQMLAALLLDQDYLSQGCEATSLYSPNAFQVPFGPSLPYVVALQASAPEQSAGHRSLRGNDAVHKICAKSSPRFIPTTKRKTTRSNSTPPILSIRRSPSYRRRATIRISCGPPKTITASTRHPAFFTRSTPAGDFGQSADPNVPGAVIFCDPQLGCSSRLVAEDLSNEHAWQLSQEIRLASNFDGPLNFSIGGNYLHYETEENYYVFINALTAILRLGRLPAFGECPGGSPSMDARCFDRSTIAYGQAIKAQS